MDKKFVETAAFFGKVGADNLLLMLIGIEHIVLFVLKWSEGKHYRRLWLYLYEGAFFIGYSFFNDIYIRYKGCLCTCNTNNSTSENKGYNYVTHVIM